MSLHRCCLGWDSQVQPQGLGATYRRNAAVDQRAKDPRLGLLLSGSSRVILWRACEETPLLLPRACDDGGLTQEREC